MKNNMKKILILIGSIVLLFVLVLVVMILFSSKTTICTIKSDQSKSGYVLDTKYVIKSKKGIVSSVKITEVVTSNDAKKLSNFEKNFNDQYKYNSKNYGGYTYKVVNGNGKVVSNVTIDYNEFNMEKFVKNNVAMKEYIEDGKLTLDGAKNLYESTGAKCK